MTAPAAAAGRFAAAVLLGLAAGLLYGFLRPLRRRRNWAADLVLLAGLTALWVYHSFAVCRGDIRLWGLLGLLLGCRIWDVTAGRLLRPLFSWFWGALRGIFKVFLWPFTKILKIFPVFVKKLFASGKKSGTIKWKRNDREKESAGGHPYAEKTASAESDPVGIPPGKPAGKSRDPVSHCAVDGSAADPNRSH